MFRVIHTWLSVGIVLGAASLRADGPKDNIPESVRPIPPVGIEVPDEVRAELDAGLQLLEADLTNLRADASLRDTLLPDVEIFHKAVRYALIGNQFYNKAEFANAKALLEQGRARAASLLKGEAPWTRQTGLVVRGYRSKIDGDVQPYGLVIPETYRFNDVRRWRLDFWFHGRGERLSEAAFINQRQKQTGQFAPPNALVLHPYGRYSNANKFAGEIDLFEALAHAQQTYRIDEDRLIVRGFSMGGAACWQFAVHYADRWCAAAPGAGFSETPDFLRTFQGETLKPAWYERQLWQLYDCTDWAANLFHCPTVAYSGENDRQKQAADMMERALREARLDLVHIIGKGMGHKYDAASKLEIERRISAIAERGRERVPRRVRFTTRTLRYNKMRWVTVDALAEHFKRSDITAELIGANRVEVATKNVTAFTLGFGPGECPLQIPQVTINGMAIQPLPPRRSDQSWTVHFRKTAKAGQPWVVMDSPRTEGLAKRHGLQGPIDDAFMDSFLMVSPTGKGLHPETADWVKAEQEHAVLHWRLQFRGDARVKMDSAVTEDDIGRHHLILWGDPASNGVLKKIIAHLPIGWTAQHVTVRGKSYGTATHMPVLIFPNPLNPEKYVVLNSGFTYREYDYLNNARQVPKLPDWAVVDITQPVTSQRPGGIADAGFFDEQWRIKAEH